MANIVGTITKVKDYISPKDISLRIQVGDGQDTSIDLAQNRVYSIPEFQRELRWSPDNINTLLADASRGSPFLGNIILARSTEEQIWEIIDGQQRTTALFLIVACIRKKHGGRIEIPQLCPLENKGFAGLQKLINHSFDKNDIPENEWDEIVKTDLYYQMDRFQQLWNVLMSSELLANISTAKTILKNILDSEINIIVSYSQSDSSIQFFLDVNLKGVRLDTEDIFKSYLFSQDSRKETRMLWQDNKSLALKLNHAKGAKNEKRYPLMKIYEHFFYCDLYTSPWGQTNGSDLKYGEDFCLEGSATIEGQKYYQGTHLIEVINDQEYLYHALSKINFCLRIMIDIIESSGPSDQFKALFKCSGKDKFDQVDIENCHKMLQKIILDSEVIPKVLALKYISEFLDDKERAKKQYKSIYSIFVATILFTILANKKQSNTFYGFTRSTQWVDDIEQWLYAFVLSSDLTKGKLLAAYKFTDEEDGGYQRYRCKAFAAICNFIKLEKAGGKIQLRVTDVEKFGQFLSNDQQYSIEHFIIADSCKLEIATEKYHFPYTYSPQIKKYRNSLFNYLFIPKSINQRLGDNLLWEKLDLIMACEQDVTCGYSTRFCKMISSTPHKYFRQYPTAADIDAAEDEDHAKEILDNYFSNSFSNDLLEFANDFLRDTRWD